jgi:hypothetical protein
VRKQNLLQLTKARAFSRSGAERGRNDQQPCPAQRVSKAARQDGMCRSMPHLADQHQPDVQKPYRVLITIMLRIVPTD